MSSEFKAKDYSQKIFHTAEDVRALAVQRSNDGVTASRHTGSALKLTFFEASNPVPRLRQFFRPNGTLLVGGAI